jgi:Putative auto-transporter adhesin, head GIN domain
MRSATLSLTAILAPALLVSGCGRAEGNSIDETSANRSFALSGFDQVALKGSDDVRVVTGAAFAVSATGPQSVLDQIEIKVDGNTLTVSRKNRSGWHMGWSKENRRGAIITVTMPAISGAALAGSGDLSVDSATGPKFEASIAGSGNLTLASTRVETLVADVAGSGNMSLAGSATKAEISIAGSGDVSAASLTTTTADVLIAGSGNVNVRATGSAKVSLMGSGDVTITGTKACAISKVGSGNVTCTP